MRFFVAPRMVERRRGRAVVTTILLATLSLAAGNGLASCASDDPSCITNGTVEMCAKSVSEGVSVTIDGLSKFLTGSISVASADFEMPIATAADGKLPAEVSEVLAVPRGSTVTVRVSDGTRTVEISVKASG